MNATHWLGRGLWWLICGIMSVIVLLAGLLLGAFFLARSPSGEAWLSSLARDAVAKVLPEISFTALRGPLPERLEVEGLSLHDADGEWLAVESLSLVPDWRALLDRRLVIVEVRAKAPVLRRLPILPPDPAPDNAPPPAAFSADTLTSWLERLPPDVPPVRVERLHLEKGIVGAAVLGGWATLRDLDLQGRADLSKTEGLTATLKAHARIEASARAAEERLPELAANAKLPARAELRFSGKAALRSGGHITTEGLLEAHDPAETGGERLELAVEWNAATQQATPDFTAGPAVTSASSRAEPDVAPNAVSAQGVPAKQVTARFAARTRLPAFLLNAVAFPDASPLVSAPLAINLAGQGSLGERAEAQALGTLAVEGGFLDEPLQLSLNWEADTHSLLLDSLRAAALGLALKGQVKVNLGASQQIAPDLPVMPEGTLHLAVDDWKALARALKRAGLSNAYAPLLTARQAEADLALTNGALKLALRVDGWDERVAPFRLEGRLTLPDGAVQLRTGLEGPLAVLRRIPELTELQGLPDGLVKAELRVGGRLARPEASLGLTVSEVSLPELPLPKVRLEIAARLQPPSGNGTGSLFAEGTLSGLGSMPARLEARLAVPFGSSGPLFTGKDLLSSSLSGSVNWSGPLADWWRFVPVAGQRVRGEGRVRLGLKGTLAAPQLDGELALDKASWDDQSLGIAIAPIDATVLWQGREARFTLTAGDGRKGTFEASGRVGGPAEGFALDVQGRLARFAPLRRNDVRAVFSGTVKVAGTVLRPDLAAAIMVDEGDLRLARLPGAGIPELPVVAKGAAPVGGQGQQQLAESAPAPGTLDVKVTVPGRFFVRGHGLDSEWRGQVDVRGPLTGPRITGELASQQGTLELLGKVFTLAVGRISLDGQQPPNPALDIVLRYAASAIVAEAAVSGTVARPRLALSSAPPLPQDEVVSQVLFGTSASSLTRAQALQLAASVASLAGMGDGGFGILDLTRKVLGVDVLRMGGSARSGARQGSDRVGLMRDNHGSSTAEDDTGALEAGKYLSDKIYVGVEQGLGPDSGAVRVEVDLAPNVTLEARTSSKASDIGINWKKDY